MRHRVPWFVEDTFGVNMNYHCAKVCPETLRDTEERSYVKNDELEEIKKLVFKGSLRLDEPIDIYSKHTVLHDAVVMNRMLILRFMLQ